MNVEWIIGHVLGFWKRFYPEQNEWDVEEHAMDALLVFGLTLENVASCIAASGRQHSDSTFRLTNEQIVSILRCGSRDDSEVEKATYTRLAALHAFDVTLLDLGGFFASVEWDNVPEVLADSQPVVINTHVPMTDPTYVGKKRFNKKQRDSGWNLLRDAVCVHCESPELWEKHHVTFKATGVLHYVALNVGQGRALAVANNEHVIIHLDPNHKKEDWFVNDGGAAEVVSTIVKQGIKDTDSGLAT